jgi:hypothetical protein
MKFRFVFFEASASKALPFKTLPQLGFSVVASACHLSLLRKCCGYRCQDATCHIRVAFVVPTECSSLQ